MSDISIKLKNVTLDIPMFGEKKRSLKNAVLNKFVGGKILENEKTIHIRALDNINLNCLPGDSIGLLGHNGSGKSSLLRTISGIYKPTSGQLITKGKIITLINNSDGIDEEMSGYKNILLRGLMLGLSKSFIKSKIDEILEFSELKEFIGYPLRTYSNGMKARLLFAINTIAKADILIIDEDIGAADENFSMKIATKKNTYIKNSTISIIASHNKNFLKKFCNKIAFMEKGKIINIIRPSEL